MDDEEAKRIQEERDKQLTEEYKDVTNPKKPEKKEVDLVEIAKRKNPDYLSIIKEAFGDITESGEVWDESRQQFLAQTVAPLAQKVDDSLTNITGQNWVGDRSRNVINFGADILTPTSGDLAVGAAVLPLTVADGPLPFGDAAAGTIAGLKYGKGVTSRAYRKLTTQGLVNLSTRLDDWLTNPIFSKANRAVTPEGIELSPTHMMSKGVSGGGDFAHSILKKTNRGLYKQLKDQDPRLIDQAESIIKELDLFKTTEGSSQQYAKWSSKRPTTGFRGTRTVPYINSDGVASEVAFRWSISKNTYVPYDLVRRQNTVLKRLRWNVNRSLKAKWYSDKVYKIAKQDNATLKKLLEELREENPQRYFDLMGDTRHYATNKGFIFVEHIHAQNSPYWKYVSKGKYKPRDTKNLMIVKNENFGKLKTSIENHIYNNKDFVFPDGKRLILDYDKTRDVLVLKQLQDTGIMKRIGDISPITNPRNWRRALDAALEGHTIKTGKLGEIQQVIQADQDVDKVVDLQHGISDWK